jgi:hypothetical protein
MKMMDLFKPAEQFASFHAGQKNTLDSAIGWRGSWFYMADKPAPSQARDLPPFKNVAAESRDSWTAVNDESATPYVKLLARRIAKLSVDGLKGIDTINCWISHRIQPLQHRNSLMHEYTGANDGMHCSDQELDLKAVEKRIRSLMKSPRKKPLKFGMAMFENGSCPLVSSLSAIVPYDTFTKHNIFLFISSNCLVLHTLHIPFATPTPNLPLRRKLFTLAGTKRRWRGMWRIQPIRPRLRWFPRNGPVAGKLAVVAGNLLIPIISKLNAGRSYKHHPRIPLLSVCPSQGNLWTSFSIIATFHI